jgi:hypothetical protein
MIFYWQNRLGLVVATPSQNFQHPLLFFDFRLIFHKSCLVALESLENNFISFGHEIQIQTHL